MDIFSCFDMWNSCPNVSAPLSYTLYIFRMRFFFLGGGGGLENTTTLRGPNSKNFSEFTLLLIIMNLICGC
jgi:hypothetical protein